MTTIIKQIVNNAPLPIDLSEANNDVFNTRLDRLAEDLKAPIKTRIFH